MDVQSPTIHYPLNDSFETHGAPCVQPVTNTKIYFQFKQVLEHYDFLFKRGRRAGVFSLYF
jgi:hypothetical protein